MHFCSLTLENTTNCNLANDIAQEISLIYSSKMYGWSLGMLKFASVRTLTKKPRVCMLIMLRYLKKQDARVPCLSSPATKSFASVNIQVEK